MSPTMSDHDLKARHRTMWASGDYPAMVQTFLLPLGPRLVEACGIEPGMHVLDVASGTGNAAIPAADLGAAVVAGAPPPPGARAPPPSRPPPGAPTSWRAPSRTGCSPRGASAPPWRASSSTGGR